MLNWEYDKVFGDLYHGRVYNRNSLLVIERGMDETKVNC